MAPNEGTALSPTTMSVPTAEANLQKSCHQRAATLLSITEKYTFCVFLEYHSNDNCAASIGLIRHLIIADSPQIHRGHITALTYIETPPRTLQQRPTSRLHCMNNENEKREKYISRFLAYHLNDDCEASVCLIRLLIITDSSQIHRGHTTASTLLETPPRTHQQRPTSRLHCMKMKTTNETMYTFLVSLSTSHSNDDCEASACPICHLIITDSPQIHHGYTTALI
eukprot:scaffold40512_cov59-Attheya_sp.AAC.2